MASKEKFLHDAYARQATEDSKSPKSAYVREKSTNEKSLAPLAPLTCFHGKSIFESCRSCNRSKVSAAFTLGKFLNRFGIARQ